MHVSISSAIVSLRRDYHVRLGLKYRQDVCSISFRKLKEAIGHPLRIHDPFSKDSLNMLFKFLLQSFVTLHENVPLIVAFIPCQRW